MIRWGLLLLTIIANLIWVVSSLGAGFVTWAQIVPKEISCAACSQPEVQSALVRAAEIGRLEVISTLPSVWLVLGLALFNTVVIAVLLFNSRSSHTVHGTLRDKASQRR